MAETHMLTRDSRRDRSRLQVPAGWLVGAGVLSYQMRAPGPLAACSLAIRCNLDVGVISADCHLWMR